MATRSENALYVGIIAFCLMLLIVAFTDGQVPTWSPFLLFLIGYVSGLIFAA